MNIETIREEANKTLRKTEIVNDYISKIKKNDMYSLKLRNQGYKIHLVIQCTYIRNISYSQKLVYFIVLMSDFGDIATGDKIYLQFDLDLDYSIKCQLKKSNRQILMIGGWNQFYISSSFYYASSFDLNETNIKRKLKKI